MNRVPRHVLVGALSVLLLACGVAAWVQTSRLRSLRLRAENERLAWKALKERLEDEVEDAENQSLFFSTRLVELERSREEKESDRDPAAAAALYRFENRCRDLESLVGEVSAKVSALETALGKREDAGAREAAALKELLEEKLGAFEAAAERSAAEIASIEERLSKEEALTAAARERLEAGLSDLAGKVERLTSGEDLAALKSLIEEGLDRSRQALEKHAATHAEELAALRAAMKEQEQEQEKGNEKSGEDTPGPASPPREAAVEAPVEAVDPERGLLVIGAGKDRELAAGQTFGVFRDGRRIATIRVIRVAEELAGASIVHLLAGEVIRKGDVARLDEARDEDKEAPAAVPSISDVPPPPPPAPSKR